MGMRTLPARGNAGDDEAGKADSERRKWAFGRMRAWAFTPVCRRRLLRTGVPGQGLGAVKNRGNTYKMSKTTYVAQNAWKRLERRKT